MHNTFDLRKKYQKKTSGPLRTEISIIFSHLVPGLMWGDKSRKHDFFRFIPVIQVSFMDTKI